MFRRKSKMKWKALKNLTLAQKIANCLAGPFSFSELGLFTCLSLYTSLWVTKLVFKVLSKFRSKKIGKKVSHRARDVAQIFYYTILLFNYYFSIRSKAAWLFNTITHIWIWKKFILQFITVAAFIVIVVSYSVSNICFNLSHNARENLQHFA
jgi:hypothetical protein